MTNKLYDLHCLVRYAFIDDEPAWEFLGTYENKAEAEAAANQHRIKLESDGDAFYESRIDIKSEQ